MKESSVKLDVWTTMINFFFFFRGGGWQREWLFFNIFLYLLFVRLCIGIKWNELTRWDKIYKSKELILLRSHFFMCNIICTYFCFNDNLFHWQKQNNETKINPDTNSTPIQCKIQSYVHVSLQFTHHHRFHRQEPKRTPLDCLLERKITVLDFEWDVWNF